MLKIGQRNQLIVHEILPFGYALIHPEQKDESQIVTLKETEHEYAQGEKLDVFVYMQNDRVLMATTKAIPIQLGKFARLLAVGASDSGYFFDWGIKPDLYVPQIHAHGSLSVGSYYVARLIQDKLGRVLATTKIEQFLSNDTQSLTNNQAVSLLVYDATPLGYKAIVNESYQGLLYKNELSTSLSIGQQLNGFIKQIRKDGKLDLSLHLVNEEARKDLNQIILDDLSAHGGMSTITDKSSPDEIFAHFKVSKAAYKRAIGSLYKQRLIRIEKNCIYLN